jgi:hypothetical protein
MVRFSTLCPNCLRPRSGCNCEMMIITTTTLLRMDFAIHDIFVPVPTRLHDDLPDHVKGLVYWNPNEQCYHLAFEGDQIAIEFINNAWFSLSKWEGGWHSCPALRFPPGTARMGWWATTDPQHPDNRQLNTPWGEEPQDKDTDEQHSHHLSHAPSPQNQNNTPAASLTTQMNTIQIHHDSIEVQARTTMTKAPTITGANLAIRTVGALPGPSGNRPPQGPPGGGWPQGPPGGGPPGGGWPQGPPGGGPPRGGWPQGPPGGQEPATHGWITGSLAGRQPTTFEGDRDKSEAFMDEWNLYYLNNCFHVTMATPYQQVTQCLTHILGPKVANWKKTQVEWLNDITTRQVNPVQINDP